MLAFIIRRIMSLIPVLLIVGFVSFLMVHFAPGDPAVARLGVDATPDQVKQLREEMGLNRPLLVQFVYWLYNALKGNLGDSYSTNMGVSEAILQRLPPTATLAVFGYIIALFIGIPAGIVAAVKQNKLIDQAVMSTAVVGISLPSFVMGLLLILIFSLKLRLLPSGGYTPFFENPIKALRHVALPALSVGLFQASLISRMTRSSMLEVLRQDYIRTARSKGAPERIVVFGHGLRNALIPILTIVGMGFGVMMGGVVVTETVFAYPGLGRLAVFAIQRRDYPLVQGVVLVATVFYVVINLLVDISYSLVDPRLRYGIKNK